MAFSLDELNTAKAADEGKWLEIIHPKTGQPTDMHIKLLGADSETYKKTERRQQSRHLKRGLKHLSPEDLYYDTLELLVACTVEWQNIQENGQELECTRENVRRVYSEYDDVRDQVREFVEDRGNFLGE